MNQSSELNGVPVRRLRETADAIRELPALGTFRFRVSNEWLGGTHNRSTIKDFHGAGQEDTSRETAFVFNNDEPEVLLGTNRGPNPMEFLLHGLAGCVTTTLVYHAALRGIRIDSLETRVEGELDLQGFLGIDPAARSGFHALRVTIDLRGDAEDAVLEELCRIAELRSGAFDSLMNGVPIAVTVVKTPESRMDAVWGRAHKKT